MVPEGGMDIVDLDERVLDPLGHHQPRALTGPRAAEALPGKRCSVKTYLHVERVHLG
jgi:hypothetical protein